MSSEEAHLATLSSMVEAKIVQSVLEGEGIPSRIDSESKSNRYDLVYDAFSMNFGRCALFVPKESLEAAQRVLQQARSAGEALDDTPENLLEEDDEHQA